MYSHDLIPHFLVHIDESLVPQDTGIRDENVHRAKGINSGFDDSIAILSGADGSDSLATN